MTPLHASLNPIPTFYPTWDEFRDFSSYMTKVEAMGGHHVGLCKIVPPPEWIARKAGYEDGKAFDSMIIKAPIMQSAVGGHGIYQAHSTPKPPMSVQDFRKMANSPPFRTPDGLDTDALEKRYWASMGSTATMYGADVCGSLTDKDQKVWNISKLGSILDIVLGDMNAAIAGVNTAYLYFGMYRATFAWHVEDVDLYSINFIHWGEPKFWYVIPPAFARRFESFARDFYSSDYEQCSAFLRHKTAIISPSVLQRANIPVHKVVHNAGEIMITFPMAYHSGFNMGFNMAESTNFALERWIDIGKRAVECTCSSHCAKSVTLPMEPFVARYQPERLNSWLRGEEEDTPHPLEKLYAFSGPGKTPCQGGKEKLNGLVEGETTISIRR